MSEKKDVKLTAPEMPMPASAGAPSFRTTFACMSLNMGDRLRLIQFPQSGIDIVRGAIASAWRPGIQSEREYHGAYEFKMHGNPWYGQGSEAVPSRRLMCSVLASMYDAGWVLKASTDISKKQMDKDSLLFRLQYPPPPPSQWFAISFNRGDRMRLIDAPEEVIPAFKECLGPMLQKDGEPLSIFLGYKMQSKRLTVESK